MTARAAGYRDGSGSNPTDGCGLFAHSPEVKAAHTEEPCVTFHWIGQDFAFCDRCSRPYWRHSREFGLGDKANTVQPVDDATRIAVWRKWHPDRPRWDGRYITVLPEDREPLLTDTDPEAQS